LTIQFHYFCVLIYTKIISINNEWSKKMALRNSTKRLAYILAIFLVLSLAGNSYLIYHSMPGKCCPGVSKSAVSGAVGTDPTTDCQLCEAVVNMTYKYLPDNADMNAIDSVVAMVFKNVPTDWHYLIEDIQNNHLYEYKSYIEKKFQGRYIAGRLNYCREY
jgi:hypothetical protein